jgi:hypothetical protein
LRAGASPDRMRSMQPWICVDWSPSDIGLSPAIGLEDSINDLMVAEREIELQPYERK